jgi:hypothetical protein
MTTVGSGVGRADHEGVDRAVPKLRAGKGRGKGKGRRSGEGDVSSSGSSCGDTGSSTDESTPETSAASSDVAGWTRRLRQDNSDWSAFNDDVSDLSD